MATLAEIRARLRSDDKRSNFQTDNAVYAHWNIPDGSSVRARFLPDGNEKNEYFWVERQMIKLPFNGVKGQGETKLVTVQVPCVEMWDMQCPVLTEARLWFKDPSLEDMGRKYWKKRSYIFQGFVRESPMSEENVPDNPIRRWVINPQIFTVIKASLMDPEIEVIPTDYKRGLDFTIVKDKSTGSNYANYTTSKWSRKESALTTVELAAIEEHGLFNLEDFLPNKPNDAELQAIQEMFEASVDGQPYDPDKWGTMYKPYGLDTGNATKPAESADKVDEVETKAADKVEEPGAAEEAVVETKSNAKAEDILAMIRSRQKA